MGARPAFGYSRIWRDSRERSLRGAVGQRISDDRLTAVRSLPNCRRHEGAILRPGRQAAGAAAGTHIAGGPEVRGHGDARRAATTHRNPSAPITPVLTNHTAAANFASE